MRGNHSLEFTQLLSSIVSRKNLFVDKNRISFYATGIRVGSGVASAVVFPRDLVEFWKVIQTCVNFNRIIIVQAANTGLTGGSTPYGDDYDREVVIVNTRKLDQLILLNGGMQVVAFPGTTLNKLEDALLPFGRGPHSVIGSSCIGASVIGGICNNSGGNLVKRGPAYTELSLYAQLNTEGKLILINHLGIPLGEEPEEILFNLQNCSFDPDNVTESSALASDREYQTRVRNIQADSPARFNADKRRLYEASGSAGKIAIFAVRLDTFPKPKKERVFFLGTNNPIRLTIIRKKILTELKQLPEMGEYMHYSYFDGADKYCKDTFLMIKYFGSGVLPTLLLLKRKVDQFFSQIEIFPKNLSDRFLQFIVRFFPDHLPKRLREYRSKFDHYMLILASDLSIAEVEELLNNELKENSDFEYIICSDSEAQDALLHRYVAGAAPGRFCIVNQNDAGDLLPLDIALPRNCDSWNQILPDEIISQMSCSFMMGHFLCMVFHWDFVVKKGVDSSKLKKKILEILDQYGAKYPAEHNVGHLYRADEELAGFYRRLDPTNSFNSGIGMTSKKKFYK